MARTVLLALVAISGIVVATVTATGASAGLLEKNCGDFANQAGAQQFYEANSGPAVDPHNLDADGDGVACESLPCPCQGPGAGGSPIGDTSVDLVLTGPNKVRVGKPVRMFLRCALEPCDVTAQVTYKVPKPRASAAGKKQKLKTARVTVPLQAGSRVSLTLNLVGKAKRQLTMAAKKKPARKKIKVTVKATAKDAAGTTETERLRPKLK